MQGIGDTHHNRGRGQLIRREKLSGSNLDLQHLAGARCADGVQFQQHLVAPQGGFGLGDQRLRQGHAGGGRLPLAHQQPQVRLGLELRRPRCFHPHLLGLAVQASLLNLFPGGGSLVPQRLDPLQLVFGEGERRLGLPD